MTETEQALYAALVELEAAVLPRQNAAVQPNTMELFARIDELTAALPRPTDPDLLHYLHRKSYVKARLWLEGRQVSESHTSP